VTPLATPIQMALAAVVIVAGIWDIRSRRIPNFVAAAGLAAGFAGHAWLGGWEGLKTAALGFGLACLVYLPLYLVRAIGGGDVKLMAAVGSLAGPSNWLVIFVFTAVLGGAFALLLAIVKGRLRRTLWNVGYILGELARLRAPHATRGELDVGHPEALRLPHGAVIAVSTLVILTIMGS
jgi:prepilin peptidase CpaA